MSASLSNFVRNNNTIIWNILSSEDKRSTKMFVNLKDFLLEYP